MTIDMPRCSGTSVAILSAEDAGAGAAHHMAHVCRLCALNSKKQIVENNVCDGTLEEILISTTL